MLPIALLGLAGTLIGSLVGASSSEEVSEEQTALGMLQLEEQKRLNQFQIDEYLDKKDYDRALQERIFEREDTAMQRSLQDHIDAGFSPLSAIGQTANAGSIVSTSSAPSLNAPSAPDLSGMYQAISHLVNGGNQASALVSTYLSQMSQQQHDVNMENLRFANALDQLSESNKNQKEILRLQADLNEGASQAQHIRELEKIASTQEFQKTIEEFKANQAKYLQVDQQEWQSKQAELDRQHQIDMQNRSHDQTLEVLDIQDKQKQQYEKKTLAYAWSDLSTAGKKLFTDLVAMFDKDVADYINNNEYGGDLLMRVVAMYESALPVLDETKNLLNPLSGLFGK